MLTTDLALICRIALEDGRAGETLLDTAQRVCQENYGDQADTVFSQLLQAVQAQMMAGAAGPDAAITALADAEDETDPTAPRPPQPPWWRFWS